MLIRILDLLLFFIIRIHHYIHRVYGLYWLRRIGVSGIKCQIKGHGVIVKPESVNLGDYVAIGERMFFVASGGISIGDHTVISRNCVIQTQTHDYDGAGLLPFGHEMICKSVRIGKAVWIGMNVTILPGVEIADGAVIGMNAVVTKSVPRGAICVGSPARVIKFRNLSEFDRLSVEGAFINLERY